MNLPSADDLFTTQEERDHKNQEYVKDISIYEITDFPNHPFKVKMDDKMLETIESVRDHGVLVPALVREKPTGGYEMISGHRRKMASELAGKETMPCIVRNLSDDQAVIVMVDSNLQREEILPSEKAFAYKMKLDAMKRQGQRRDLTSVPLAQKFKGKNEWEGKREGRSWQQVMTNLELSKKYQEKDAAGYSATLEKAGKVFQKNPLFMAKNLMLKGEDEAAVRLLENDTEKLPYYEVTRRFLLGVCYYRIGKEEQGKECMEYVIGHGNTLKCKEEAEKYVTV